MDGWYAGETKSLTTSLLMAVDTEADNIRRRNYKEFVEGKKLFDQDSNHVQTKESAKGEE
jgi:hypothetical protein